MGAFFDNEIANQKFEAAWGEGGEILIPLVT
jgi:hypothetical protein